MTDALQLAIKAAIIENRAIHALQLTEAEGVTDFGKVALHHMADGMLDALSILTAEPVATIRARVRAAAADQTPCNDITRPRLRVV